MSKKVLVTGVAGFIGSHLVKSLHALGYDVAGCDKVDPATGIGGVADTADPLLARLRNERLAACVTQYGVKYFQIDLGQTDAFASVVAQWQPDTVVHLAAQAGVRHSMQAPMDFVTPNLVGFSHVLDACHRHQVPQLLYASSSSVYGMRSQVPFLETDRTDQPQSFYAATKMANEMMAYAYHSQYGMASLGMRFFTVYGPWGRPDMAPMLFAKAILAGEPIRVFNQGRMRRDFTYIDDIVSGVIACADKPATPNPDFEASLPDPATSWAPHRVFNIGNAQPTELLRFISVLEQALGREAIQDLQPMQPGDVVATAADTSALEAWVGFRPSTSIEQGVEAFARWYRDVYVPMVA